MRQRCKAWKGYQRYEWHYLICDDPKTFAGKPVIKGTLIPVFSIVRCTGSGMTLDEVMCEYRLMRVQVIAALAFAAEIVGQDRFGPLLA